MKIIDFKYSTDFTFVRLYYPDGGTLDVYFNEHSGQAYQRDKINTLIGVDHPGIYIGRSEYGEDIVIHNHYEYGRPTVDTISRFLKGQQLRKDFRIVTNNKQTVITKALNHAVRGEKYSALSFNCQDFVNEVLNNKRKSESVNKVAGGLILGALALGLIGVIFSE